MVECGAACGVEQGLSVSRTEYEGFGVEYDLTPASDKRGDYRFAGKHGYVTDTETGMQLLGARYYLPAVGRFLTQDPIGHQGGLNLYADASNNPVNRIDPKGTDSFAYVIQGNEGLSLTEGIDALFGTHSMMALQIPDGRYISASWEGKWTLQIGVNPYDTKNIYHEGNQVFALHANTTKKQDEAMLNRLAYTIGRSVASIIKELDGIPGHTQLYTLPGHSYNAIWDNCTTRLWDLLGMAGYGYKNLVSAPNSLFDLKIKQFGRTNPQWTDLKK